MQVCQFATVGQMSQYSSETETKGSLRYLYKGSQKYWQMFEWNVNSRRGKKNPKQDQ